MPLYMESKEGAASIYVVRNMEMDLLLGLQRTRVVL